MHCFQAVHFLSVKSEYDLEQEPESCELADSCELFIVIVENVILHYYFFLS